MQRQHIPFPSRSLSFLVSPSLSLLLLLYRSLSFGLLHLHFNSSHFFIFPLIFLSVALSESSCLPVKHGNFAWQRLQLYSEHTQTSASSLSLLAILAGRPHPPLLSLQFLSVQFLNVNCKILIIFIHFNNLLLINTTQNNSFTDCKATT